MRKIIVLCSLFIFGCNGGSSSEAPQTTVTEKAVSSIHITYSPINGTSEPKISYQSSLQLTATAYYEDHSKRDISEQVQWISSDQRVGTITSAGLLKGVNAGTTAIMAQLKDIESNAVNVTMTDAEIRDVQIAPKSGNANNLPEGVTLEMVVTGTFSDNTHQELQRDALQWSSSNGAVARKIQPGVVKAINKGRSDIKAEFHGVTSNTVEVTVTDAVVTKLQISSKSGDLNIPAGFTQPLVVTGTFSDLTGRELPASDITWSSANTSVATVNSTGIIKGVSEGSTAISAQYNGVESEPLTVTITDATLAEITITSSVSDVHNVVKGNDLQLVATGVFSDSSEKDISADVSWLSDDESIAMVNNSGSIHAVEVGRAVISAEFDDKTTNFTVDIDDAPVTFYVKIIKGRTGEQNINAVQNNEPVAVDDEVSLIYKGDDIEVSVESLQEHKQATDAGHNFFLQKDEHNHVIGFAGYVNAHITSPDGYYPERSYTTFFAGHSTPNKAQINKTYSGNIFYTRVAEDDNPKVGNISIQLDEKHPSCHIDGYADRICSPDTSYDGGEFIAKVLYSADNSWHGNLYAKFFGENGEFAVGYIQEESTEIVNVFLLSTK